MGNFSKKEKKRGYFHCLFCSLRAITLFLNSIKRQLTEVITVLLVKSFTCAILVGVFCTLLLQLQTSG